MVFIVLFGLSQKESIALFKYINLQGSGLISTHIYFIINKRKLLSSSKNPSYDQACDEEEHKILPIT
jgi:hypothetical protein